MGDGKSRGSGSHDAPGGSERSHRTQSLSKRKSEASDTLAAKRASRSRTENVDRDLHTDLHDDWHTEDGPDAEDEQNLGDEEVNSPPLKVGHALVQRDCLFFSL